MSLLDLPGELIDQIASDHSLDPVDVRHLRLSRSYIAHSVQFCFRKVTLRLGRLDYAWLASPFSKRVQQIHLELINAEEDFNEWFEIRSYQDTSEALGEFYHGHPQHILSDIYDLHNHFGTPDPRRISRLKAHLKQISFPQYVTLSARQHTFIPDNEDVLALASEMCTNTLRIYQGWWKVRIVKAKQLNVELDSEELTRGLLSQVDDLIIRPRGWKERESRSQLFKALLNADLSLRSLNLSGVRITDEIRQFLPEVVFLSFCDTRGTWSKCFKEWTGRLKISFLTENGKKLIIEGKDTWQGDRLPPYTILVGVWD